MPLYDYRCPACRRAFEALLDRWDSPAPACPHCGAGKPVRQLSVFAVTSPAPAGPACGETGACGAGGCGCCSSTN